jgi:hypothetical protein
MPGMGRGKRLLLQTCYIKSRVSNKNIHYKLYSNFYTNTTKEIKQNCKIYLTQKKANREGK